MGRVTNVLLVGVGGQGTILASKILSNVLVQENYDVKMNEIHGMSQRGGSVITHVRYGDKIYAPTVDIGQADMILAFEELEAMRYINYLKSEGCMIVNLQQIHPASVSSGKAQYPQEISKKIQERVQDFVAVDAVSLAKEAGEMKAANVVLLGVLAKRLGIPIEKWEQVMEEVVPNKFIQVNKAAFSLGYQKG